MLGTLWIAHAVRTRPPAVALSLLLGAAGCATQAPPSSEPTPPATRSEQASVADTATTARADESERQAAEIGALERQIGELQLRLLESGAQVSALQANLDEAIREAVRSKAKLQSVDSRAEAASTMAEAEIALGAFAVEQKGSPLFTQAEALMQMAASEFDNENYGGALYLATQAKDLAGGVARLGGDPAQRAGEVPFALALPLQVLRASNVREGSGTAFKVLFMLEEGTRLSGHADDGQWVRVSLADGRSGWIYSTLVGSRPGSSR